jgi:glyoxylase-like metal-dependent hydrolase (beta-lactamase superfamily II)
MLQHDRAFEPQWGAAVPVAPRVRRITAENPGPFTFHGTNTYLVGDARSLAVIDPGPDDPRHLAALLAVIGGARVSHILVTHTHRDHSPGAAALAAATGAPTLAAGPHRPARPPRPDETARLDAGGDTAFVPDLVLANGAVVEGDGFALTAVATPGHTGNHLAFALDGGEWLFSGDHVMAWSTSIVAPPDGAMADYMASLTRLAERVERRYLPGHGGIVEDAPAYVAALAAHRQARERAIRERLEAGDDTIPAIVRSVYVGLDAALTGAAGLSVLAHLEDLVARGLASADPFPTLSARYRP